MSKINHLLKKIFRREKGQAIVEFALIAPIFMFFLLGMLQIGFIMNYENGVLAAAREGARVGAITGNLDGAGSRKPDIQGEVVDTVEKYIEILQWDKSKVTVDTNSAEMFPDGTAQGGDRLKVTVTYPIEPFFPMPTGFIGEDDGNLLGNQINISHSVVTILEDI